MFIHLYQVKCSYGCNNYSDIICNLIQNLFIKCLFSEMMLSLPEWIKMVITPLVINIFPWNLLSIDRAIYPRQDIHENFCTVRSLLNTSGNWSSFTACTAVNSVMTLTIDLFLHWARACAVGVVDKPQARWTENAQSAALVSHFSNSKRVQIDWLCLQVRIKLEQRFGGWQWPTICARGNYPDKAHNMKLPIASPESW